MVPTIKKMSQRDWLSTQAGNVIVAGYSYNLSNADCQVIKYGRSRRKSGMGKTDQWAANANDEWAGRRGR
jgi:hypothetical protein